MRIEHSFCPSRKLHAYSADVENAACLHPRLEEFAYLERSKRLVTLPYFLISSIPYSSTLGTTKTLSTTLNAYRKYDELGKS